MTIKGYALIDGPNIANAAQAMKKLTVGETEVQAIYGTLKSIRAMAARYYNLQPVVLWDGLSWRKSVFPEYKSNRDKAETKHEKIRKAEKIALNKQIPILRRGLEVLGIPQVFAANYEADDLAYFLARRYSAKGHKVQLVTADKDWLQLVDENTVWYDPIKSRQTRVTLDNFEEITGVETPRQFVELKAMTGDTGDNVPPIGGIGEKTGIAILKEFRTVASFENELTLVPDPARDKRLGKRAVDFGTGGPAMDNFSRNMQLVDLAHKTVPPPADLDITKEPINLQVFRRYCDRLAFSSITKDLEGWCEPFMPIEEESIAA